jgi:hypothetical protein
LAFHDSNYSSYAAFDNFQQNDVWRKPIDKILPKNAFRERGEDDSTEMATEKWQGVSRVRSQHDLRWRLIAGNVQNSWHIGSFRIFRGYRRSGLSRVEVQGAAEAVYGRLEVLPVPIAASPQFDRHAFVGAALRSSTAYSTAPPRRSQTTVM